MEKKVRETTRQVLAVVLAVALCFAFLPDTVLAEGDEDSVEESQDIEITEEAAEDKETAEAGGSSETEGSEEADPSQSEEDAPASEEDGEQENDDDGIMLLAADGTCGDNLTWNLDDGGVLTISGTGAMDDYTASSGTPWYDDYDSIVSVVVEDGVTSVGNYAFYQCPNLASVSFGDDLITIGSYAFRECTELGSDGSGLDFPDSLEKIEGYAFRADTSIQKITFGSDSKLTDINLYAFYGCSGISEAIDFPDSLQSIAQYSFYNCTNLPGISFGSGLTSIGDQAFRNCTGMSSELAFPDSLESIGARTFNNCPDITGITFGSGLTSIGNYAFQDSMTTENAIETTTEVIAGCKIASGLEGTPEVLSENQDYTGVTVEIPDSASVGTSAFSGSGIEIFVFGSSRTAIPISTYNSQNLNTLIFTSPYEDVKINGVGSTTYNFDESNLTVVYGMEFDDIVSYNKSNPFCGMTLQEAVYAVADGSMESPIIIEKDISLSSTLIVPADFAGTITVEKTSGYWIRCKEDADINPMITVAAGADLTFDGYVELSGVNTVTIIETKGAVTLTGNVTVTDGDIETSHNGVIHVTGSDASLTLDGNASVKNHTLNATYSAVILVDGGASFTMTDGTVSDITYSHVESGAILALDEGTTVNINGGVIKNIEEDGDASYNAPVVISDKASISFTDGTISDNYAQGQHSSSGILIYDSGSGEMTGGTIENNTSEQKGSAIMLYSTSRYSDEYSVNFTMSGGVIRENKQVRRDSISDGSNIISSYGGTVYVADNSSFKMTGGEITGNSARSGGGVAVVDTFDSSHLDGTFDTEFILDGGTISDNTAVCGGGIYTFSNGTELISGYITDNHATDSQSGASYDRGGGVYSEGLQSNGYSTVHMYNVVIMDNQAGEMGGGLWCCSTGQATIYVTNGGVITENSARGRFSFDPDYGAGDDLIFGNGYGSTLRLSARILGGGKVDWYKDGNIFMAANGKSAQIDDDNYERYDPDNPGEPYEPEVIYSSQSIASKAVVQENDAIEFAKTQAKLFITGNEALDEGGGVAANGGITIGVDEDLIDISGTKVWDDNENEKGLRPDSITVYLKVRTSSGESYTLESMEVEPDDEGNWNWEFTDLPKVDESGEALTYYYYIDEENVEDYVTDITGDNEDGYEIKNKLVEPKFTKEELEDDYDRKDEDIEHDDDNGHFEENIEGDGWGSWDDADNNQEIIYRMTLTDIRGATNVTVHDYLEDGLDFVKFDDTEDVDVILYDYDENGDLIERHLVEGEDFTWSDTGCTDPNGCAMKDCTFEIKFADEDFEGISDDAYIVITYKALTDTHEGDYEDYEDDLLNQAYMTYGVNSYRSGIVLTETDLFGFGVYKYAMDDEEEIALEGAEFVLEKNGQYATFEVETDEETGYDYHMITGWVDGLSDAGTLASGADGMIRIEGLDDDTYTLTETKAPAGYTIVDKAITVEIDEDGNVTVNGDTGSKEAVIGHEVNVENVPAETVDISGSKTWEDNNNQAGHRPEEIIINLLADGEKKDSATVTEADGWAWSFNDLYKYDEDGHEIVYTITEDSVADYSTEYDGYDVINIYTPGQTSVSVVKIWDDDDDTDGIRPESITVELVRDDVTTGDTLILSEDNDWAGSFTELDMEDADGNAYVYSVKEISVEGYTSEVSGDQDDGYVITNTHTPTKVPETKTPGETGTGAPKTSDTNNLGAWLALMIACAVIVGDVCYIRRRRNKVK